MAKPNKWKFGSKKPLEHEGPNEIGIQIIDLLSGSKRRRIKGGYYTKIDSDVPRVEISDVTHPRKRIVITMGQGCVGLAFQATDYDTGTEYETRVSLEPGLAYSVAHQRPIAHIEELHHDVSSDGWSFGVGTQLTPDDMAELNATLVDLRRRIR